MRAAKYVDCAQPPTEAVWHLHQPELTWQCMLDTLRDTRTQTNAVQHACCCAQTPCKGFAGRGGARTGLARKLGAARAGRRGAAARLPGVARGGGEVAQAHALGGGHLEGPRRRGRVRDSVVHIHMALTVVRQPVVLRVGWQDVLVGLRRLQQRAPARPVWQHVAPLRSRHTRLGAEAAHFRRCTPLLQCAGSMPSMISKTGDSTTRCSVYIMTALGRESTPHARLAASVSTAAPDAY